MVNATVTPSKRPSGVIALVVVLSAVVFLLACAGLLNAAVGRAPMPRELGKAAIAVHLTTILLALPLGVSQLVLPKGTLRHRTLGYAWLALMSLTALVSFGIHSINKGGFSPIHLLSILTLTLVPVIVLRARRQDVKGHRDAVLGLMIGGLVIAGAFTFLPSRILGQLLLGLIHPT
jgi:uncharacterized membrane protein